MAKSTKNNISKSESRPRVLSLDIMVGLAMIFVVVGHQSFDGAPLWYVNALHEWIYRFHMEVFVFLSAFLIRYSYKGVNSVGEYLSYIGKKLKKFFIPFLLVGVVVALAGAWSRGVDKADLGGLMGQQLKLLLLYPMQSEASFLWYIYVLFGYYLVSPLVIRLPRWAKMVLCVLSMGLPLLRCSHFLGGYLFCKYSFFYLLGVICAEGTGELKALKTWVLGLVSVPFVIWSVRYIWSRMNPEIGNSFVEVGPEGFDVLSGCMALPFFYVCGRLIEKVGWLSAALSQISKDCFWIYLLQMFVAWGCMYVVLWINRPFPFALFLVISSVLCIIAPMGARWLSQKLAILHLPNQKKKK